MYTNTRKQLVFRKTPVAQEAHKYYTSMTDPHTFPRSIPSSSVDTLKTAAEYSENQASRDITQHIKRDGIFWVLGVNCQ